MTVDISTLMDLRRRMGLPVGTNDDPDNNTLGVRMLLGDKGAAEVDPLAVYGDPAQPDDAQAPRADDPAPPATPVVQPTLAPAPMAYEPQADGGQRPSPSPALRGGRFLRDPADDRAATGPDAPPMAAPQYAQSDAPFVLASNAPGAVFADQTQPPWASGEGMMQKTAYVRDSAQDASAGAHPVRDWVDDRLHDLAGMAEGVKADIGGRYLDFVLDQHPEAAPAIHAALEAGWRPGEPLNVRISREDASPSTSSQAGAQKFSVAQMRPSPDLINYIKNYEVYVPNIYNTDGAQADTIGYGHKLVSGDIERYKNKISEKDSLILLQQDLSDAKRRVDAKIKVPLTQHEYDALLDLSLNSPAAFGPKSSVPGLINEGKVAEAGNAMSQYIHARVNKKWVVVPGLIPRRRSERDMLLDGKYDSNH